MNFSGKLDLDEFFAACAPLTYALIKCPAEFPNYYAGSDIDVFCGDIDEFCKAVLKVGERYVSQDAEFVVKRTEHKCYVDFVCGGAIDFRFDLYGALPSYRKVSLKPFLFQGILDRRIGTPINRGKREYCLYQAGVQDDLLLRYVEYLEWYERRHDKIKHLNYILSSLQQEKERREFLNKLHLYTELPPVWTKEKSALGRAGEKCAKTVHYVFDQIRSKGVRGCIRAVRKRYPGGRP